LNPVSAVTVRLNVTVALHEEPSHRGGSSASEPEMEERIHARAVLGRGSRSDRPPSPSL